MQPVQGFFASSEICSAWDVPCARPCDLLQQLIGITEVCIDQSMRQHRNLRVSSQHTPLVQGKSTLNTATSPVRFMSDVRTARGEAHKNADLAACTQAGQPPLSLDTSLFGERERLPKQRASLQRAESRPCGRDRDAPSNPGIRNSHRPCTCRRGTRRVSVRKRRTSHPRWPTA